MQRSMQVYILGLAAWLAFVGPATASTRMVLGEEFSNTSCGQCFYADALLDTLAERYGDSLALIRYHVWEPDDPFYEYNREENEARSIFYGSYNTPRLWVDGPHDGGYNYEDWENVILNRWGFPPLLDIELSKEYDYGTRRVDLNVELTALDSIPVEWDLRILVVITESDLYWRGSNGSEWHNQVMRDIIPSSSGDTITIQEGQLKERFYSFTIDSLLVDHNCEIVVLVQDFGGSKNVLQAGKIRVVGAAISCETITPIFCRAKNFYFQVTIENTTSGDLTGQMRFRAYAGPDCRPENTLITIPRNRTYPPGVTTRFYYFKVPNVVTPRRYSTSVEGVLQPDGARVSCCMNTRIIECEPWKVGDNAEWELVEADDLGTALPAMTELRQSYPNPFNSSVNVSYCLAEAGDVTLRVYDLTGRLIATLVDGFQEAGEHVVTWEASAASSGIYFYKLEAGEFSETRSMSLMR